MTYDSNYPEPTLDPPEPRLPVAETIAAELAEGYTMEWMGLTLWIRCEGDEATIAWTPDKGNGVAEGMHLFQLALDSYAIKSQSRWAIAEALATPGEELAEAGPREVPIRAREESPDGSRMWGTRIGTEYPEGYFGSCLSLDDRDAIVTLARAKIKRGIR
jgi:hypothetical protein